MSALPTCAVLLDWSWYYPGDVVRGKVVLTVERPATLRALNVEAVGQERLDVTTDSAGRHQYNYSKARVLYRLHVTWPLQLRPLLAGTYVFPFSFMLPHGVAPTATLPLGSSCTVSHRVRATLTAPGRCVSRCAGAVEVLVQPPLPAPRTTPGPLVACTVRGRASVAAQTSQMWYYPGESVKVAVHEARNGGRRRCGRLKLELQQQCDADMMRSRTLLARRKETGPLPRGKALVPPGGEPLMVELPLPWQHQQLLVPSLAGGSMIAVRHKVKVYVDHGSWLPRMLRLKRASVYLDVVFRVPAHEPRVRADWVGQPGEEEGVVLFERRVLAASGELPATSAVSVAWAARTGDELFDALRATG